MNKTELQKALEIVKPGLGRKEMIEQSMSFAFTRGRVVTYNDEISISHPVDDSLGVEGVVQAEELYQLLGKLEQDEIEITVEKNEIVLKAGRVKARFTLEREIKLPLEEIGKISEWKKLPGDFLRHVKFAMMCCSQDMTKPVLTCVHVREDGFIEGSDSFRIVRCLGKIMPVNSFLIPAISVVQLIKLKPTEIAEGSGWMHFQTDEKTMLSCRVFDDTFPDCSIHMEVEGIPIVFPKTIDKVLDRAVVFASREKILDESVTITLENNRLKVESKSDSSRFEEEMNFKHDGDLITFDITPSFLKDIVLETSNCTVGKDRLKFEGEDWDYLSLLRAK